MVLKEYIKEVEDEGDRIDTYHLNITVNYFFDGYPHQTFFVLKQK